MTHALNLTLPIKQTPEAKAALEQLKAVFADRIQGQIDAALRKSKLVHFARVLVIDDKYIQVITEYEGSHQAYTEFFRRELTPIFGAIFGLMEETPDVKDPNAFWESAKKHNVQSLGKAADGALDFEGKPAGWLFSVYEHRTVEDVLDALQAVKV
jgi:hypothetical protein